MRQKCSVNYFGQIDGRKLKKLNILIFFKKGKIKGKTMESKNIKNKNLVGIVVASHNNKLAEEIINFAKVLRQEDFPIVNGGDVEREVYGTNVENMKNAVISADSGAGVLIFVDMGSSIFNAMQVVKELEGEIDARIVDAPIVEGVLSAVAANSSDMDLEDLRLIAEESRNFTKLRKEL